MSDATKTKNFDTLEVGAWYRSGFDEIHNVIEFNPSKRINSQYRTIYNSVLFGNCIGLRCPDGRMWKDRNSQFDLIERVNEDGTRWEPE
jgi:hypothetical protein